MDFKMKSGVTNRFEQHVLHVELELCQGIVEEYGLIQLGKLRDAIAR